MDKGSDIPTRGTRATERERASLGNTYRILVVDDEQMIRMLAQKILERSGYEVLLAESGEDGIKQAESASDGLDLVVVDMSMEGLSGIDTIGRLRELIPDLPAIISTGHMVDISELPPELVANTSFLQKPYRATDLSDAVKKVLE